MTATSPASEDVPLDGLRGAIDHAAHLLPEQGPIGVFIHHNTLHAFEHLPFEEAVRVGGEVFGCQPFLSENRYREALGRGRIRVRDLRAVLADEVSSADGIPTRLGTVFDLKLAMLQYPSIAGSAAELRWFMAETDALRTVRPEASAAVRGKLIADTRRWVMRDLRTLRESATRPVWVPTIFARFPEVLADDCSDSTWEAVALEALWSVCRAGVAVLPPHGEPDRPPIRHRDLLLRVAGMDPDRWVHEVLARFTAAFIDQGVSQWPLPDREKGYFAAFCSLYRRNLGLPPIWMGGLSVELGRLQDAGVKPLESIRESLADLGVDEGEWGAYLSAMFLALRGWAGIVRFAEQRPDRFAHPVPAEALLGFVAVRLLLERFALRHAARTTLGYQGPLAGLRDVLLARLAPAQPPELEERAFSVFQLAQVLGWAAPDLAALTPAEWTALVQTIEGFDGVQRRRVFHLAYERRFREQTLDALARHDRQPAVRPRFQVVTCIDEREESFRRHLEEVAPECETFGAAGFFAVAMYYRGAAEAHFVPLCPVVIRPQHWVEERVEEPHGDRNLRVRRALGRASHKVHVGSRTFAFGAVLTAGIGVLASIPLVARVLFPGITARLRRRAGWYVAPPKATRLHLERSHPNPGPEPDRIGYTVVEMTGIAERVLRDIGLIRGFSRLVLFLGHGSHSMNNPHESAHDCGACGGAVGGPNGRAIAQILNDPRVRERLAARGLTIPADTVFVGGLHNTCNEYAKFADLDRIPDTHRAEFDVAHDAIETAIERNAHERARRFESAPLSITFAGARQHMDARAEDLSQVRPEWGHATNAICVVGRRERTRGLYLDRRAFLTSYDPTQDDEAGTILARTMGAIFPVCGGINLEYYFCHTDPTGYGCGTKLPHNITALVGVMDGAQSDLRTGLPWQMTEIHEPVRLLIVCETTPAIMQRVLDGNPLGRTMTQNGWVHLAVLAPDSNDILFYRDGAFRPYAPVAERLPRATSSVEWYRGWREHLEFAEIAADARG